MANALQTIKMVTKESVRLFENSNSFLKAIDKQYSDEFANSGAKIGNSLNIRLPVDYTVRTGPIASIQDTAETVTSLTLNFQQGVDFSFTSADLALSVDQLSERYIAPAINNLTGAVAANIMTGAESICNYVSNQGGGNAVISPTFNTWATAKAYLDMNSTPMGSRNAILDPVTEMRTVSSFSGLFNNQREVGRQYMEGSMGHALGMDWWADQTVIKHTTGAYVTASTVNGAGQVGSTIVVSALSGPLNVGDVITFAGVFAVNRITKQTTGMLRQFSVVNAAATGATSLTIFPALIPPAANGSQLQYQTVTNSPANGAALSVVTNTGETYRKNFVMSPLACTFAAADLPLPDGVELADRSSNDSISIRTISQYNVQTDQFITRLDILYGFTWIRPEWACIVADAL